MTLTRTLAAAALATTLLATAAAADTATPPFVAAPADATPVVVMIDVRAKDPAAFKQYLQTAAVIPVTRLASGITYSWSTQDENDPERFVLIQGWNSAAQQQAYIGWREETGALADFVGRLQGPPTVTYLDAFDTATLPAQVPTN